MSVCLKPCPVPRIGLIFGARRDDLRNAKHRYKDCESGAVVKHQPQLLWKGANAHFTQPYFLRSFHSSRPVLSVDNHGRAHRNPVVKIDNVIVDHPKTA